MTKDTPVPPLLSGHEDPGFWFKRTAGWVALSGPVLGGLAACSRLASGGVAAASLIDALYWWLLHSVCGLLAATPIRALEAWASTVAWRKEGRPAAFARASAPSSEPVAEADADRDGSTDSLAEARRLIGAGEWEEAADRVRALVAERGGDPAVAAVVEEMGKGRRGAGERLRAELQAAREVNDPDRVLDLYEAAPRVLDEDARRELEQDLAKWFLTLVHRRLRSGVLQIDVVTLVDRVSEKFGHTKEGASLRAALPTLRRGAGLCPRCGKPYVGFSEACPECLGRPEPPPPTIPGLSAFDPPETEVDLEEVRSEPNWFLDPDEDPGANGRPAH